MDGWILKNGWMDSEDGYRIRKDGSMDSEE